MSAIAGRRYAIEGSAGAASIGITVVSLRGARPGPTLALLSGVHGDEWEGIAAVGRLCRLLHALEIRGEVRVVAVCNEPAYEAAQRCSPLDGLDLARCFPGDRHGRPTERLAALLDEEVIAHADFLVDLHSAGLHYTMPALVGYMGGETTAARTSTGAAAWFGAEAVWRHPPPPPAGRTITAAYARGIPWIYAETTGAGELRAQDVDCYTMGVQHVMQHLDMLDGALSPAPAPLKLAGDGDLDGATVRARHAGMFIRSVELLQVLNAGDTIGVVVDPAGEVLETLVTPRKGVVVLLRHTPRIAPGERICHLADLDQEEPRREPGSGSAQDRG